MSAKLKNKRMKSLIKRWCPRDYMQMCVDEGIKRKYLALFLDPGLGKTSIILQIFNKLKIRKQAKAMLVIAPLNPCYMTWPEEIQGWTNFKRFSFSILHGPKRDQAFAKQSDIYIINPESLPWLISKLKSKHRKNWPFDMLIVDESSKFKNPTSVRTKLIAKMIAGFKYRYIANGTPVANGYLGLMSQMRIVDQGKSLGSKITHYREKYFIQIGKPEWKQFELKADAEDRIMKKIAPYCICLRAEDHVKMPERIIVNKHIEMPKKALKAYEEIEKEMFTLIDEHELVAESAASLSNKLHQLCGGAIYEDQDPLAEPLPSSKRNVFTLHTEKLKALDDLIEEFNGQQVLIGYKFHHDKTALQKHFKKRIKFFNDAKTGIQKQKLQKDWNAGKIDILAGNPSSVGHGLNLQKGGAQIICMYTIDHDYETYDQFIRRLLRSGNTSNQIYICHILAKGLFDEGVIYPRLKRKQNVQDSFLRDLIEYKKLRQNKSVH